MQTSIGVQRLLLASVEQPNRRRQQHDSGWRQATLGQPGIGARSMTCARSDRRAGHGAHSSGALAALQRLGLVQVHTQLCYFFELVQHFSSFAHCGGAEREACRCGVSDNTCGVCLTTRAACV
mmetsp:Transcript_62142/g.166748  ORF Transcript_62142/g.166748 Transcript_62142/m.166748 type:complete len:123 (-) Transcript_62142:39-407(-)